MFFLPKKQILKKKTKKLEAQKNFKNNNITKKWQSQKVTTLESDGTRK